MSSRLGSLNEDSVAADGPRRSKEASRAAGPRSSAGHAQDATDLPPLRDSRSLRKEASDAAAHHSGKNSAEDAATRGADLAPLRSESRHDRTEAVKAPLRSSKSITEAPARAHAVSRRPEAETASDEHPPRRTDSHGRRSSKEHETPSRSLLAEPAAASRSSRSQAVEPAPAAGAISGTHNLLPHSYGLLLYSADAGIIFMHMPCIS